MPSDKSGDRPVAGNAAVLLSLRQRVVTAVVGAAGCGLGVEAVFSSDNQAGTTALLLIGGTALLMALVGRVPDRISRDGIDYVPTEPAQKVVEKVLTDESTPLDTREALALAVREELDHRLGRGVGSQGLSPDQAILSGQADHVLWEATLVRALEATTPDWARLLTSMAVDGRRIDGLLVPERAEKIDIARSVAIEVALLPGLLQMKRGVDGLAAINAGASVYITDGKSSIYDAYKDMFQTLAEGSGLRNFYLALFDPNDVASITSLRAALQKAWQSVSEKQPT